MYEVKTEVKIIPDGFESVNRFFHEHVFRSYIELGAKLRGRWVDEDCTLITEIWAFHDKPHYQQFFDLRKQTSHYKNSVAEKLANDKWIISKKETHMEPTGEYFQPLYSVSASVFAQNDKGETLLVRSLHRSDTLELPGGVVDYGESLKECAIREAREETGLDVEIVGLVYVSQNISNGVVAFVFHGKILGGELTDATEETKDVGFYDTSEETIDRYVKRTHFKERVLQSQKLEYIPMDIVANRPYSIIERMN